MFGEESEMFVSIEDIIGEEIYSFESLEFKRVEETACCTSISVEPVGCDEASSIEVASLDDIHVVGGLSVEPSVHGV